MKSYEFLAGSYDELTGDVDYPGLADYIEKQFSRTGRKIRTVLDLACGTGSLTRELAVRGYEMIGVDVSGEMLAVAEEKCRALPGEKPIFLQQDMAKLDLYGTVDACICCLDSVNYMRDPKSLRRAFGRVELFLEPGGLFLFDVNTPEKLRGMDGEIFLDEREDVYCVWRCEYSSRRRICSYGIDLFRLEADGTWSRGEELHEERAYELRELEEYLRAAGFIKIRRWGERKLRAPRTDEGRVFFTARKGG